MKDERNNVVKFQPRPKPPKPKPKPRAPSRGPGEPAINWSRAPKAAVLIAVFLLLMWLVGGLAGLVGRIGMP